MPSSHYDDSSKYPEYSLRLARYRGLAEAIAGFLEELREQGVATPPRLLDVGVGRGRVLRYLERLNCTERVHFFGIDKSPCRLASIYRPERWRLQQVDVEQGLPYASACFDIIVCEQVLEHLACPEAVLGEMIRVARPGALIVLGVPTFPPGLAAFRRHVVPLLDAARGAPRSHLQVYSFASFQKLIGATNALEVSEVRGFRILSGGPLRPLEHSYQWYRFNRWLGRHLPVFATEIQVIARRHGTKGFVPFLLGICHAFCGGVW